MTKFNIIMSSDEKYVEFCAEIFFEDQFVAILTQEKGFDNLEIEIHPPTNDSHWNFEFYEFFEALKLAKSTLWKMRKNTE